MAADSITSVSVITCCTHDIGDEVMNVQLASNDTVLNAGETALLTCVGYGQPSVSISWTFFGQTLERTSLVNIYEERIVRDNVGFTQSFLEICDAQRSQAGGYYCVVSNGKNFARARNQLTVSGITGNMSL